MLHYWVWPASEGAPTEEEKKWSGEEKRYVRELGMSGGAKKTTASHGDWQ